MNVDGARKKKVMDPFRSMGPVTKWNTLPPGRYDTSYASDLGKPLEEN
jgi:hypothetical protein